MGGTFNCTHVCKEGDKSGDIPLRESKLKKDILTS